jgi:uncharacterized OB-fold protein
MKHPAPRPGTEAAPYWQGAREGRLRVPYCPSCATFAWPPRRHCTKCGANLDWRDARGSGSIAAWSVVRRAANPDLKHDVPYIVALIDLDEGVRLFGNIVDAAPADVRAGRRVRCRFAPSADPEIWVPVFAIAPDQG